MLKVMLVACFGTLGALSRYGISSAVGIRSFPYATLAINVVGSFALGVVLTLATQRIRPDLAIGLAVGFLGAFTTFSTLSWDTFSLLRTGRPGAALLNVAISIAFGVGAASLGYVTADHFIAEASTDTEVFHVLTESHPEQALVIEHNPDEKP